MLSRIKAFFDTEFDAENKVAAAADNYQLAAAALMIEIATADTQVAQSELDTLSTILQAEFQLQSAEITALIELARQTQDSATSLYQFTQRINSDCSAADKYRLVANMWRIAYADGHLDKYEEHLIRRVADLIHLSHSEFIRAKHDVRPAS